MLGLIGESHDFCFDRRAVAGAYGLYLSVEQRRVGQAFTQYTACFFVGVDDVTVASAQCAVDFGEE